MQGPEGETGTARRREAWKEQASSPKNTGSSLRTAVGGLASCLSTTPNVRTVHGSLSIPYLCAVRICTRQPRTALSANMLSGPPRLVPILFAACVLALVVWHYRGASGTGASLSPWTPGSSAAGRPSSLRPGVDPLDFSIPLRFSDGQAKPAGSNYTFKIVVPKTTKEDLEWMQQEIPHAPLVVYEVDNDQAAHRVPKNKGREAMVRPPHGADRCTMHHAKC